MKPIVMTVVALCACSSSSTPTSTPEPAESTQEAAEDKPAQPETEAGDPVSVSPDVYKVLQENDRFRVMIATWAPGQRDKHHRHPRLVAYALTAIKGTHRQQGDEKSFELPERSSTFQAAVKSQSFENTSDRESKMLIVELKKGEAEKPKGKNKDAPTASPDIFKEVLDLEEVRVLRATWKAKQKEEIHAHPAHAVYFLTDFKGREVNSEGKRQPFEAKAGSAHLAGVVEAHVLENLGGDAEALYFELK